MKIAVVSDIHGNLEAFTSVLSDIKKQNVDSIISLGDNIGYGADSEEIIQLIRRNHITSIMGNHELAATNETVLKWFREDARKAVIRAKESLSESSIKYLNSLKVCLSVSTCLFVHGFPPDSLRLYLFQINESRLLEAFHEMPEQICFVGHTHDLVLVYPENDKIHYEKITKGTVLLEKDKKYIINAGSVGQPRDGDAKAKYLIWDSSTYALEIRSLTYDVKAAASKIIAADIPLKYAKILDETIS